MKASAPHCLSAQPGPQWVIGIARGIAASLDHGRMQVGDQHQAAALQHPDIQSKLAAQGLFSVGMCGGDFAAFLRKQSETYGSAIRASNIQAN